MTTLKCTKCNKEFNHNGFIKTTSFSGLSGKFKGKFKILPIWLFQTTLKTICPECKEETINTIK